MTERDTNGVAEESDNAADTPGVAEEAEAQAEPQEPAAQASKVVDELERLQREMSQLRDRHLRLAAEFDNYRKRIERERVEMFGRAQADLVSGLLDALDDLRRVTHQGEEVPAAALLDGMRLVERKLFQALEAAGLEPLSAEGKPFDPATMEAVATVPTDVPEEDHVVADVFQTGYTFRGQLLRPARVRVMQHEA